jgi:tetratricopeptide (TPR) repeat protein
VIHSDYTLPADVDVLSLFPHAHYLAKTMRAWATLPDRTQRGLLRIDDWDFNWQDAYTYAGPISLPAGTTLSMEFVYDNSNHNVHNPNDPLRRVTTGEKSTDEMGNITFTVLPHDARGLVRLRVSNYERLLGGADMARNQYNLANALADDGRIDDATAHYRRAIEEDPCLAPALFNLGNLLLAHGEADNAIGMFGKAVECKPDHVSARINLGHALEAKGRLTDAIDQYRAAIASDGRSVLAHANLGAALAKTRDRPAAIAELRQALALDPADARVRRALDALLADAGG